MSATIDGRFAKRGPPALRSAHLSVLAALLALAAVSWLLSDLRMAGMDSGPGTDPGAFGFYITTWVVMMAAMMLPSVAPIVLTYRRTQAARSRGSRSTAMFVVGYLVVWGASGVLAYAVLKAGRSIDGGLFSWHRAGRWVAAGVLAAAAAYELTPLKQACLSRCRSPFGFFAGRWRGGPGGALRMGLEHGAWCLGCCWLLMVGLFALGAMSITWMLVITALIAAEKLLPMRALGVAVVVAVTGALAVGVAAAPQDVPGLTIPGSGGGLHAMGQMHAMGHMGGSMHSAGGATHR
jgi:predicted metal-binding membrane protein